MGLRPVVALRAPRCEPVFGSMIPPNTKNGRSLKVRAATFSKLVGARGWAFGLSVDCIDLGANLNMVPQAQPSPKIEKATQPEGEAAFSILKFGRGERIRTSDPHNPIVVRYQAALRHDRDASAALGCTLAGRQ